jgi:hypothetical protein
MLIRTSNLNFSGEFNQIKDVKLLTGVDWLMTKKFYPMDCGVQGNKKPETLF